MAEVDPLTFLRCGRHNLRRTAGETQETHFGRWGLPQSLGM